MKNVFIGESIVVPLSKITSLGFVGKEVNVFFENAKPRRASDKDAEALIEALVKYHREIAAQDLFNNLIDSVPKVTKPTPPSDLSDSSYWDQVLNESQKENPAAPNSISEGDAIKNFIEKGLENPQEPVPSKLESQPLSNDMPPAVSEYFAGHGVVMDDGKNSQYAEFPPRDDFDYQQEREELANRLGGCGSFPQFGHKGKPYGCSSLGNTLNEYMTTNKALNDMVEHLRRHNEILQDKLDQSGKENERIRTEIQTSFKSLIEAYEKEVLESTNYYGPFGVRNLTNLAIFQEARSAVKALLNQLKKSYV